MLKIRIIFFLLFINFFLFYNTTYANNKILSDKINKLIKKAHINKENISIYIYDTKSKKVIFKLNENKAVIPASNEKIITTAAAIILLKPNYRFKTLLYTDKLYKNKINNLIIYAEGDPTFTKPFYKECTTPFEKLITQLKKIWKISEVKGDIIINDLAFSKRLRQSGLKRTWYEEPYCPEISPLAINENNIEFYIKKDLTVEIKPYSQLCKITNKLKKGYKTKVYAKRIKDNEFKLEGTINKEVKFYKNIHNPSLYSGYVLKDLLNKEGIKFKGKVRFIKESEYKLNSKNYKLLAIHVSKPLFYILKYMNKESDNFFAEQIFRTIGFKFFKKGAIYNTKSAIYTLFKIAGINIKKLNITDGSGLSILNRISTKQIVRLLIYIYNSKYREVFIKTLPKGGEGTLEYRLNDIPVRAKTGTLNNVSALSGFIILKDKTIIFSIISNNFKYSPYYIKDLEDKIIKTIYNYYKGEKK